MPASDLQDASPLFFAAASATPPSPSLVGCATGIFASAAIAV